LEVEIYKLTDYMKEISDNIIRINNITKGKEE